MTCSHGILARCDKLAIIVSNYYHFDSGIDKNGTVFNLDVMCIHDSP